MYLFGNWIVSPPRAKSKKINNNNNKAARIPGREHIGTAWIVSDIAMLLFQASSFSETQPNRGGGARERYKKRPKAFELGHMA